MFHISDENRKKAKRYVAQMTLEEKARMHTGSGAWHTETVERIGLKNICLTDGPHGLRKEIDESAPMCQENTVKATCFPTAVANSCSFDRDLLYEMGQAMAEECLQEEVGIILGPAANIKRSPLCGRNFEYFSEDPYVAGECAQSLINGIQSKNVGTSLKHFLANNQEAARLSSSSCIDERALREIYLPAFEAGVKKSQPFTIMCSYNRINGTYASNNKRMLTDILRDEWGYEGFVMTDWGAMADRAESVRAGIDLEMPSPMKEFDLDIIEAVKNGELAEEELDKCIERVVAVVLQTIDNQKQEYDRAAHHELARRIARESAVLLKNDNAALPLAKGKKIAVIGSFAKQPRYQGAGSSQIAPPFVNTPFDEFTKQGVNFVYAQGVDHDSDKTNDELLHEALQMAQADDVSAIVAMVGLPDAYESEGYDRTHMRMPESHNTLMDELTKLGKPVISVIMAGSAVEIPWRDKADALLLMNLSGQNVGGAVYDLVFGDYSPCGKLTETFPISLTCTPSNDTFGDAFNIEYRESIFVGYRYYDTAEQNVAYPFGHGLSYTSFEYSDIKLSKSSMDDTDAVTVTAKIKNTGKKCAKEIVQLYVRAPKSEIFRPVHELRDFCKVELAPGEEKTVEFELSKRAFAYYNVNISDWHVISGTYTIELASSSRDIRLCADINVKSTVQAALPDHREDAPFYYNLPKEGEMHVPHEEFAALFDDKTPLMPRKVKPFDEYSTLHDLQTGFYGKRVAKMVIDAYLKRTGKTEIHEEALYAPMCSTMFPLRGKTRNMLRGMVLYANGHIKEGEELMGMRLEDN